MSNYGTNETLGGVYRVENILAEVYDPANRALRVYSGGASYSNYESRTINPGASADGYDVKNTGGFFSSVVTSYRTIIKNNNETSTITLYLNTDGSNPITLKPTGEFDLSGFAVTNIFIDTELDFGSSSIEITLFG